MSYYSKWSQLKPQIFQRMVGLSVSQFDKLFVLMFEYLATNPIKSTRGKTAKFELVDQLLSSSHFMQH